MMLSSFEKTNLKSRKVRSFFIMLASLVVIYLIGFIIYKTIKMEGFIERMSSRDTAGMLFSSSWRFLVVSLILLVSFLQLRWQILRTAVLALILLSIAHLACAVLLVVLSGKLVHAIALIVISILFITTFLVNSNLRIYLFDRTYTDAFFEFIIALAFISFIARMLLMALTGEKL